MPEYEWVHESEWKPEKNELIEIIKEVQNILRDRFTFQYEFIGSSRRNMITRVVNGNSGYDFDANLHVNLEKTAVRYKPKRLKPMFIDAFNTVCQKYGYDYCEDSTRVITIKKKDRKNSRIICSCDFAIVRGEEDQKEYILHNKSAGEYQWVKQSRDYLNLEEKAEMIKEAGCWNEVREIYLNKKKRFAPAKKSRALYAESVNEVFEKVCSVHDPIQKFYNYGNSGVILEINRIAGN